MTSPRAAFGCAAFLALNGAAPIGASFADTMTTPNAINNAMVDKSMTPEGSISIYDNYDQYRDTKGFPQAGWQYLWLPPS